MPLDPHTARVTPSFGAGKPQLRPSASDGGVHTLPRRGFRRRLSPAVILRDFPPHSMSFRQRDRPGPEMAAGRLPPLRPAPLVAGYLRRAEGPLQRSPGPAPGKGRRKFAGCRSATTPRVIWYHDTNGYALCDQGNNAPQHQGLQPSGSVALGRQRARSGSFSSSFRQSYW